MKIDWNDPFWIGFTVSCGWAAGALGLILIDYLFFWNRELNPYRILISLGIILAFMGGAYFHIQHELEKRGKR